MNGKAQDGMSVNKSNLSALSLFQSEEMEKRICELRELVVACANRAKSLIDDGYGLYEIAEMLREYVYEASEELHSDVMNENRERIRAYLASMAAADKGVFSELFGKELEDIGAPIYEYDFLPTSDGEETVTYVKNKLADEAYDVFSQEMRDPRVFYSNTFRDAAKAVASDKTRFCILPIEELGGSRLSGIEELIYKHDLKINSITPVFGVDGMADMKYALVSKQFYVPEFSPDDDRYLEIMLQGENSRELFDIITAAGVLGINVYRINTLTFDGEQTSFTLVLERGGKEFVDMLIYLAFFSESHTVVGIYKNLE